MWIPSYLFFLHYNNFFGINQQKFSKILAKFSVFRYNIGNITGFAPDQGVLVQLRTENIDSYLAGILTRDYGLSSPAVREQKGGWSARAFRADAAEGAFFLKVYDKTEKTAAQWTRNLADYLRFMRELGEKDLPGQVPELILTAKGGLWQEGERYLCLLTRYIEGETLGERPLSREQAAGLGKILGRLHCFVPAMPRPGRSSSLRENFLVPFAIQLFDLLDRMSSLPPDLETVLSGCRGRLLALCDHLCRLSHQMRQTPCLMVPCHTDIHGWNLMQGGQLVLLDWEGLKYAPPEADFFSLTTMPHFDALWTAYCRERPGAVLDRDRLEFYRVRRRCEDIWEFIARILYDNPDPALRAESLQMLEKECEATSERRLLHAE